MAYAITTAPPNLSSAHLPVYFSVFDSVKPLDAITYPNYKYVADIYIGAVLITRLKAYPDPVTFAGVFDIGPIVRSYLSGQFASFTGQLGNQYQPFVSAQVKFGDEYDGTTYTNLITDSTRQYYDTYKAGPYTSPVVLTANTFATSSPTIEAIERAIFPFFATASGTINYTVNGAAATGLVTYPSGMIHFQVTGNPGDSLTIAVSGQTKTVNFGCEPRFPNRKLAFLNKYGGYDTFDFRLISRESIQIEKKTFEQSAIRLGVSGEISYNTGQVYHRGKTTFAARAGQRMAIKSTYLNDATYRWLGELVMSTDVWLYDGAYWLPVTITDTNYQYKTAAADRLQILEMEIEITGDYNSQYR
jgi:hypothetical protein